VTIYRAETLHAMLISMSENLPIGVQLLGTRISWSVWREYRFLVFCNVIASIVLYFVLPDHLVSYVQNTEIVSPHKVVIVSMFLLAQILLLPVVYFIADRSKRFFSSVFENFGRSSMGMKWARLFLGNAISTSAEPFGNARTLFRVILLTLSFFALANTVLSIFSILLYGKLIMSLPTSNLWIPIEAVLLILVMRYYGHRLALHDQSAPSQSAVI
jgi:hypothetical protein